MRINPKNKLLHNFLKFNLKRKYFQRGKNLNFFTKLIYTFSNRWYVLVFLFFYILIGLVTIGGKKLLIHCLIGYFVAFLCEAISIRYAFPFGLYKYVPDVIQKELSLFGVPVWDSLSFVFLTFFPYQVSILLYSPLIKEKRLNIKTAHTKKIIHSLPVIITAVFLMVMLDVIIDPLTLQGKKWFLGHLYFYPGGGSHFGVPISNYLGWGFTGLVILFFYTRIDKYFLQKIKLTKTQKLNLPYKSLYGLVMYYGIIGFNVVITFYMGLYEIGMSGLIVIAFPSVLISVFFLKKNNYATHEEIQAHKRDFPINAS